MTSTTTAPGTAPAHKDPVEDRVGESLPARMLRVLLTERVAALALLTVMLVAVFMALSSQGYLFAPFDAIYMASSLQSLVPIALLALAEMFVIISGYSGIDLSVGAIVSLAGMLFGYLVQIAGMPLLPAVLVTVIAGGVLGAVNGVLVGYFRFPPLIATLATQYAYASIAMVVSGQAPISGDRITASNGVLTGRIALWGDVLLPVQVLTFLLPSVVVAWILLERMAWGRSLLAVGTNEVAAEYAAQNVRAVRASAYLASGLLCGLAAVVNVQRDGPAGHHHRRPRRGAHPGRIRTRQRRDHECAADHLAQCRTADLHGGVRRLSRPAAGTGPGPDRFDPGQQLCRSPLPDERLTPWTRTATGS